jgi:serine/threonine protein kinase
LLKVNFIDCSIFLTCIPGVELFSFLEQRDFQPLDDKEAKAIFRQLVDAVQFCHQNGVVHCDLKLDNVMYDPETSKVTLIDFGLCDFINVENKGLFTKRVGCIEYAAPEFLTEEETAYDAIKMDIWCLGCILFALLNATFPFDFDERKSAIQNGEPHPLPSFPVDISSEGKDLINKILTADPAKRASLEEIKSHPWMC